MARPKNLREGLPRFWRVFRHFTPELRRQRDLIAGSLAALLAATALRLLEPWPLKFVLDRVIPLEPIDAGSAFINELDPMVVLTAAAVAVVVIAGLRAACDYFRSVGFALIGNRVLTDVRNRLYRHLQSLSLSFHSKARGGDLVVRVTSDINMLKDVAVSAVLPLLASILILVGMLAVMFWLHWKLTLLALAVVPLFWFLTVHLGRRIHAAARKQRQREGALAATASESITAIKVVQALSLEGIFDSDFQSRSKKSQKEGVKTSRLSARLERSVDLLIAVSMALVLWYGARLVLARELTPGDLVVFLTYLKRAFRPLRDFAKYTARLAKATAAGERVIEVLDRAPDVRDRPGAVPAPQFQGEVGFEDVSFGYEPGHPVFDHVNLRIEPGGYVAFVGPSGAGKSTLLGLLLRLFDPLEGRVTIDGRDIRDFTLASLRSQMAIVLQENLLFAASIRDNIAYGRSDATDEEILAAARLANANEFIASLPDGYDTLIGERGVTLSHGQRQRIAIARAMIREAPILLLDEPHTGLDESNERLVDEALQRLAAGRTTVLVTHDLRHASRADFIFYVEDRRIHEYGTHDDLLSANGRYAHLFRLQTLGSSDDRPPRTPHVRST